MKKSTKRIVLVVSVVGTFFAVSFTASVLVKPFYGKTEVNVRMDFAGTQPAMAAASTWAGVRGVATFIRNVARGVDGLVTSLNSSGVLSQTSDVGPFTSGNNRFRIQTGTYAHLNRATGATPNYTKRFQVCVGNSLALELYLSSATDPATNNGALVVWQPKLFDSSLSSSANLECSFGIVASQGASANGKKGMNCIWNTPAPFDGAANGVTRGRILAVDDTSADQVLVLGLGGLNIATYCGAQNDLYTLAFIASKASPYNTTAKWGYNEDNIGLNGTNFSQLCAGGTTHTTDAGIFNASASGYFVNDGYTSSNNVPSGYPSVASVDTLISNSVPPFLVGTLPGANITFPSTGSATPACPF